jgi:hypothetical protein
VLLIAGLAGCGSDEAVDPQIERQVIDVSGFDFLLPCPVADFFPDYLFADGARDGLESIDAPEFTPVSQATWPPEEQRVLGIIFEGQPIAVPIRIMVWHEVMNLPGSVDRVAVTYCPLTFSGLSFDIEEEFAGLGQEVGVSGLLYNSNLVLYDRQTESLWTQMSGASYAGPAAGTCLDLLPTMDTTLRFWKTLYPNTLVLDRPGKPNTWNKYELNPYSTYWANDEVNFPVPEPLDDRLGRKDWVLGVLADTGSKAYPLMSTGAVNDTLPGVPFVVFSGPDQTMVAYKAWVVDGERLTFAYAGLVGGIPTYRDDQSQSTWDFKGRCVEGPLAGNTLARMPAYLAFYFAWWSFFPETEVYDEGE